MNFSQIRLYNRPKKMIFHFYHFIFNFCEKLLSKGLVNILTFHNFLTRQLESTAINEKNNRKIMEY